MAVSGSASGSRRAGTESQTPTPTMAAAASAAAAAANAAAAGGSSAGATPPPSAQLPNVKGAILAIISMIPTEPAAVYAESSRLDWESLLKGRPLPKTAAATAAAAAASGSGDSAAAKAAAEQQQQQLLVLQRQKEQRERVEGRVRRWCAEKTSKLLGAPEPSLVDFVVSHALDRRGSPGSLEAELAQVLDDEARPFVVALYRLLLLEARKAKAGLV